MAAGVVDVINKLHVLLPNFCSPGIFPAWRSSWICRNGDWRWSPTFRALGVESLQLAPKRCDTSYCGDAGFEIQMDGETQFVDDMVVSSEGDHLTPRKVPRFWASWSFHG